MMQSKEWEEAMAQATQCEISTKQDDKGEWMASAGAHTSIPGWSVVGLCVKGRTEQDAREACQRAIAAAMLYGPP